MDANEIAMDEDACLRPQRLCEYVGQKDLKENLAKMCIRDRLYTILAMEDGC